MLDLNLTILLEFFGTFAFAVSGIRMASGKGIDWFGAYIIGLVTAIGGGTLRDLLLGVTPFWMLDAKFFLITGLSLLAVLVFKDKILKLGSTLFLFDTLGLGLFTIVGITKSIDAGLPYWVCIIMGTITGTVGGVTRDVLLNNVPLLFRRDIYALCCVAGGIVYFSGIYMGLAIQLTEVLAALTIITLRLMAVRYHWNLPQI